MKKQQSKRIDDALSKALAPPKRRPSPMLDDILSEYTAAPHEPARQVEPLTTTPPAHDAATPRHGAAGAQPAAPAHDAGGAVVPVVAGFTKVTNDLLDRILPTLNVYDQSVIIRLWRLSRGFGSDTCRVAQPKLAKACNISERQLRVTLGRLEMRGLIKRVERDFDNKNNALRGTVFRILLSDAPPARHAAPAFRAPPAQYSAPAQDAAIKENTLKETHTNIEGVSVLSRFSLAECRKYAESLRADGITNPGGYATKINRSGEADELIAKFLAPVESAKPIDASGCPDCNGTGLYEPGGRGKGMAKCKHPRLSNQ